MVTNIDSDIHFTVATESELDKLLKGIDVDNYIFWNGGSQQKLKPGLVGVIWKRQKSVGNVKPILLIVQEEELKRLYGRFSSLHSDLSPITTWCHVINPKQFESIDSLVRIPEYFGYEAAWAGLVIAEAQLLSERPINQLKISSCFSTQTYSIARSLALWGSVSVENVLNKFNSAIKLFCIGDSDKKLFQYEKLKKSLIPIWSSLSVLSGASNVNSKYPEIEESLRSLKLARSSGIKHESSAFISPLVDIVPEIEPMEELDEMSPEKRLQQFDRFIDHLDLIADKKDHLKSTILSMTLGYLSTVVAGGSPSLSLAESFYNRWPEILAWAYVIGSIGESVTWTSSFDGLGRLVARDLIRPLYLNDSPTCDVALDEGEVLHDKKLKDPFVHLRIKQARIITVSIMTGVNISLPIGDISSIEIRSQGRKKQNKPSFTNNISLDDSKRIEDLANALIPYIKNIIEENLSDKELSSNKSGRSRTKKKKTTKQKDLPLNED